MKDVIFVMSHLVANLTIIVLVLAACVMLDIAGDQSLFSSDVPSIASRARFAMTSCLVGVFGVILVQVLNSMSRPDSKQT